MSLFTCRGLVLTFVFLGVAVFAGANFDASRAAKSKTKPSALVPSVAATMTAAPTTDVGGNGAFVNPGDTLRYTATINNTGADPATGVVFTDNLTDPSLTLVPGSIRATPIAGDDIYAVTGNVRIQKPAGTLFSNDVSPTNKTFTITQLGNATSAPFVSPTTSGGTVRAATGDGSFEYNPPAGFEGSGASGDTFTYIITDSDGLTGTGTVRLDVSGMIWFIDSTAPLCSDRALGCGRLTSPYSSLAAFQAQNNGTGNNPAVNDNVFVYTGGGTYAGGVTLLNGQKLIGQGATSSLVTIAGITLAPDSDPLPNTGGARPVITNSGGNGVTLGSGNTLNGFNVGDTSGVDVTGANFGTLTVAAVALNGTGRPLGLGTGILSATFDGIASTSSLAGPGVALNAVSGSMSVFGGTSVAGGAGAIQCVLVQNSTANVDFGNTTCTGGTDGIFLQNNTAGTRTFGTVTVSGGTAPAFVHNTAGGDVTVTGAANLTSPVTAISVNAPGSTNFINFQSTTNATSTGAGNTAVNWVGTAGATMAFNNLTIQRNNATALNATTGGTINVNNSVGSITNTTSGGPAIVANGVTLNVQFASITSTASTNAISLTNCTGSSNFGAGALSGSTGNAINVSGGSISFGYTGGLTHTAATFAAVSVVGGHGGTLIFSTGTISATNGTGLQFDNADGNYQFGGPTTMNGGDAGIDIVNGSGGTFTFLSGTSINNPSGIAYREDTSTANVTYDGTITKNNGAQNAVDINAKTGGATTFSGAITASTTTTNAIDLTNTGGTVTFRGGLSATTTSGVAFNATGAGATINVCDDNPCAAAVGAANNTLVSGTGTALNVQNSTIGTNNLEFRSISANGGANGIFLQNTGTSGGLKVNGDNTNTSKGGNASGGTIQNMNGADGSTAGIGVYLNNTSNVALRRMTINGTIQNNGIYGQAVNNFTLQYATVGGTIGTTSGSNDLTLECPIEFGKTAPNNVDGFASGSISTIDNVLVSGGIQHNIEIYEFADASTTTISNSNITANSAALGSDGVQLETQTDGNAGTPRANATVTVTNCLFDNNKSQAFQASALGDSALDVTASNNTIQRTTQGNEGIIFQNGTDADMVAHITNNNTTGILGTHYFVGQVAGNATANSSLSAVISGNTSTVGAVGGPYPSNRTLIVFFSSTNGSVAPANVLVQNNTINTQSDPVNGIAEPLFVSTPDANTDPGFTASVINNVVNINDPAALALRGIAVQSTQNVSAGCIDVRGNDVNYTPSAPAGVNGIRVRQVAPATLQMEPGTGSGTVASALATNNPLSTTEVVGTVTLAPNNNTCQNAPTLVSEKEISANFTGEDGDPGFEMIARGSIDDLGWARASAGASFEATPEVAFTRAEIALESTPKTADAQPEQPSYESAFAKLANMISPTVHSQELKDQAVLGGTVLVNGAGAGFTIPPGKSTTITFDATIAPVGTISPTAFSVSNQGQVSGSNFVTLNTDGDAGTAGAQPTVTTVVQPEIMQIGFNPTSTFNGGTSTLTYTINNNDPSTPANAMTFQHTLPTAGGFTLRVASPSALTNTCGGTVTRIDNQPVDNGTSVKLTGGALAANSTCTISLKVTYSGPGARTYTVTTGPVTSTEGATGLQSNSAQVAFSALTAAGVTVSGRVISAEGRGVTNARVSITDSQGTERTLITGRSGRFSFEDVEAGRTYVISVASRRFRFTPRVLMVTDNVSDVDFVAEE